MSHRSPQTIHLHDDILWHIFTINASNIAVEKSVRLATTRIASQVCQRWREIILRSSQIWGRLVLINTEQTWKWMDVVLQRAKNASLLWVDCSIENTDLDLSGHLFSRLLHMIRDLWSRLEVLEISLPDSLNQDATLKHSLFQYMNRPAPALRRFMLHTLNYATNTLALPPALLFAGNAPLLRSFSSSFAIEFDSKWLSNMTILGLCPESLASLDNVLKWAPSLKTIHIYAKRRHFLLSKVECLRLEHMSPSILFRLSHIRGHMSTHAFNALWSVQSKLPAEYSACLTVSFLPSSSSLMDQHHETAFQRAIGNFFNHGPIINQREDLQWYLRLLSGSLSVGVLCPSNPTLEITLTFKWRTDSEAVLELLVKSLSRPLRGVATFYLDIRSEGDADSIKALLWTMKGVKVLTTAQTGMRYCRSIETTDDCQLLFPKLQTLIYNGQEYFYPFYPLFYERVKPQFRRERNS